MRVLFQSSGLDPIYGGPPVSEASLCRALLKRCDLEILCPDGKHDRAFAQSYGLHDVKVYSGGAVARALVDPGHRLSRAMKRAQVFHQNAHWKISTSLLSRLAGARGTPFLLHPRGIFFVGHRKVLKKQLFNRALGNWAAGHASALIALSQFEIPQFEPYGVGRDRIFVIPNGIDFPPTNVGASPWGVEKPFLFLGRIEQRKNIVFLVDAFAEYRRGGGDARLALVGPAEFGYDEIVRTKVKELGLAEEVLFSEPQYESGKWRYLAHARAVVYPSIGEAFGRVPFEAVAAGVPPIIPAASGSAEYLRRFFPETTYETGDRASLVKALRWADKGGGNLANAQAWIKQELDWDKIAGKVLDLYEKIARKV